MDYSNRSLRFLSKSNSPSRSRRISSLSILSALIAQSTIIRLLCFSSTDINGNRASSISEREPLQEVGPNLDFNLFRIRIGSELLLIKCNAIGVHSKELPLLRTQTITDAVIRFLSFGFALHHSNNISSLIARIGLR